MPVQAFIDELIPFIVEAKASTYAVDLAPGESSRPESHDRTYTRDRFTYLDSTVGGTDFLGQEVVYIFEEPVWAMNYYGYIIDPTFTPEAIGDVLQPALSALYRDGRFLGGFEYERDGMSSVFGSVAQSSQVTQCVRFVTGAGTFGYFVANASSCDVKIWSASDGVHSPQPLLMATCSAISKPAWM